VIQAFPLHFLETAQQKRGGSSSKRKARAITPQAAFERINNKVQSAESLSLQTTRSQMAIRTTSYSPWTARMKWICRFRKSRRRRSSRHGNIRPLTRPR